ncbi:hypothetical protein A0J61_10781, partial [Choanephora cucurbitarum]
MNQLTDKEYRMKNYFKNQFPDNKHFERFTIEPRKGLEDTFNKSNLDIGWALTGGSKKNIKGCPTRYKKRLVLHEKVQNDQFIAPESFSIGVTSLPGQFTSMAKEISSALGNQDRAKYQLNTTKASLGISFLHAFNYHYHNSANGSGTPEQLNEGIGYLKGCHMHWMQSVQRVVKNHSAVPPQMRNEFLALTYKLRTAETQSTS